MSETKRNIPVSYTFVADTVKRHSCLVFIN